MAEVEKLLTTMSELLKQTTDALKESEAGRAETAGQMCELMQQFAAPGQGNGVQNAAPGMTADEKRAAIRKGKWENILSGVKKGRIKDFVSGKNIKKHIESVEEECAIQCICYDFQYTDLTDKEKVLLLRLKLPHEIIYELTGCCEQVGTTIDTINYPDFRKLVLKQCGVITPLVNIVMQYFGPDRLLQGKDTALLTHNVKFMNELDPCMQPTNEEERKQFVDLIQRTAYYASLRDPEVQKSLSEIPEKDATLNKFKEAALLKSTQIAMHHKNQAALIGVSNSKEVTVCSCEDKKPKPGTHKPKKN